MAINSVRVYEAFKRLGMNEADATEIASALQFPQDVATKADLKELRTELKADLKELRAELKQVQAEVKADLAGLKMELQNFMLKTTGLLSVVIAIIAALTRLFG
jgi:hypothetical protein